MKRSFEVMEYHSFHIVTYNQSLVFLNAIVYVCMFRNNRITAEGAVYLAKGLMVNISLQILKVGQNSAPFCCIQNAPKSTSHPR